MTIKYRHVLNDVDASCWAPFPLEPTTWEEDRANGEKAVYFVSPPVMYNKKAWRYRAIKFLDREGNVKTSPSPSWNAETCEGWTHYLSKTNWAGMVYGDGSHGMGRFDYNPKTAIPKPLYHKCYEALCLFLYAHDTERLVKELNSFLRYKSYNKTKDRQKYAAHKAFKEQYGIPEHGDMVLTAQPKDFDAYGEYQLFFLFQCPHYKTKGLTAFVYSWGQFRAVNIRGRTYNTFYKVTPETLEEFMPHLSAHQRFALLNEAREISKNAQSPQFSTFNPYTMKYAYDIATAGCLNQ